MAEERTEEEQKGLNIQRIYVKDLSLETPNTPQIFREEWQPDVSVDLDVKHTLLEKNIFEVLLTVTVSAKIKDRAVFLVEVHQAGIFQIIGFEQEQIEQILATACPNLLFPYAREAISDLVTRASFPQLILSPVNFDVIYMQQKQKQAEEKEEEKGESKD
jgi:preprotein translocase subunit SecB